MLQVDSQSAADYDSEGAFGKSRFHFDRRMSHDTSVDNVVSESIEPRASTVSGNLGSIDDMLERCWRAQKGLSKT